MTVELSRLNTFEGGTAGGNITVANSGGTSGDAFSFILFNNASVGAAGNSAITYLASAAVLGTLGCHFNSSGTSASYLRWDMSGTGPYAFASVRIKAFPGNPSATVPLLELRSAALASGFLTIRTDGTVRVNDRTNAGIAASTSPVLTPGASYTFEFSAAPGTTTTNGYLAMTIYASDGSVFHTWSSNAVNAGDQPIAQARFDAPLTTSGWASGLDIDNCRAALASASSDWLGPFNPATPPNASASATAGAAIIDASASTGSDLDFAIELLAGPPDSGAATLIGEGKWWVPQPADTDAVWRVTVVDTTTSLEDTVDVTVPHLTTETSLMPTLRYFDGVTIQTV